MKTLQTTRHGSNMGAASWLRVRLLRRARIAYNDTSFSSSLRRSKLIFLIFRDRESLDIKARSELRLRKYSSASKSYKAANRLGYSLLDHDANEFKAELGSDNPIGAFNLLQKFGSKKERKGKTIELTTHLKRLTDTERVQLIQEMNTISPLPSEISDLLPWATSRVDNISNEGESYAFLNSEVLEIDRYRRELNRLKSSGSFQITKHISTAVRNPVKFLLLPISIPLLLIELIRRKRGHLSDPIAAQFPFSPSEGGRNCIVMFPTNGVGFGHFTRLLAVAREIKKADSNAEVVFFTTMPTLHILSNEGFVCYHLPSRYKYDQMEPNVWNSICEEMMSLVFAMHRPRAFIFDGAYPYRGMLNAIDSYPGSMLKVWLRRGAIKEESKGIPVDSIGNFHAVIRPGDSLTEKFDDELMHNIPIVRTNPIVLLENSEFEEGGALRSRLGIPSEAVLCYVQLGAGKINDINSELSLTIEALSEHENVYTVIGESLLGDRISFLHDRLRVIRDYPNSRFFSNFDFAVIAGGYNTYHEIVEAKLPSICFPNQNTGRDDQAGRTRLAEESGCMIVLDKRTKESISIAIERIVNKEVREIMGEKMELLRRENGAAQVSDWIINQIVR